MDQVLAQTSMEAEHHVANNHQQQHLTIHLHDHSEDNLPELALVGHRLIECALLILACGFVVPS